jgi:flagellin-like hook-associated protein FlgL
VELDAANDHLLGIIGDQSVSLQDLDQLESRLHDVQLAAQARLNETQGTDYPAAIVELQEQQNLLQYTLASLTTIANTSILEFFK